MKDCIKCGTQLRLTADDLLDNTPIRIGKEVRPYQVELAKRLERCVTQGVAFTTESSCGVGKSFALLLPAILSGTRTVISTATTLLQSQYIDKDLPFLQDKLNELGIDFSFALAKGRGHYLCPTKLASVKPKQTKKFKEWVKSTDFGDKKELGEDIPNFWWLVDATDCPGTRYCRQAKNCGYAAAKALVQRAQIIVANHALVGFNTRFGHNLLPPYRLLILDEGHDFVSYARNAFAARLSERHIPRLLDDMDQSGMFDKNTLQALEKEYGRKWPLFNWKGIKSAGKLAGELERSNKELFGSFRYAKPFGAEYIAEITKDMRVTCEDLKHYFIDMAGYRERVTDRERAFFACASEGNASVAALTFVQKLSRLAGTLRDLGTEDENNPQVRMVEFGKKNSKTLVSKPIEMGPLLQRTLFPEHQVISASATLTVNGTFDHHHREVGFTPKATQTFICPSPFDYANRSLLYLTNQVPLHPYRDKKVTPDTFDAALETYSSAMAEEIIDLVSISKGRALVLFSNRKEMLAVAELVKAELSGQFPIMTQEEGVATPVLESWYRETSNPILFGLKSFYQGIDLPGEQLQMLILTKAPFPNRSDPLVEAQEHLIEGRGGSTFMDLSLPSMVSDVRQAVGRLLRTMDDYGIVAFLDRSISNGMMSGNKWPRKLGRSLPFTNVTRSKKDVEIFLLKFK